jgi:NAD(P)-dependent dehydrogenase (short-subunit alcohol dehydrogenase family)
LKKKLKNRYIDFSKKNFLITGSSSGLGKFTSMELSKLGAKLTLMDKKFFNLKKTERKINHKLIKLDLSNVNLIEEEIKSSKIKKVDGFVHFAGQNVVCPLKLLSHDSLNESFRINVLSAVEIVKNLLKYKKIKNNSSIIFISSIFGIVGSSGNSGYSASKSALHGLCKSMSVELSNRKIRVNCIAPGFINTSMLKKISNFFDDKYLTKLKKLHPLGLGKPEDISNLVTFLLSDRSRWITGSIINIDGGYTAL